MKQHLIFLSIFLPILFSCRNENKSFEIDRNLEYKLLDSLCEINYRHFFNSGYNLQNSFGKHYENVIKIKTSSNNLLKLIVLNKVSKDKILVYQKEMYILIKEYGNLTIDLKSLNNNKLEIDNETLLLFKIKQLEYIASNLIINKLLYERFDFDEIQTLVVPEEDTVKVGDTFNAKIYIVTNNFYKNYIGIVEGDTIKDYYKDLINVPFYTKKATSAGEKTEKGYLIVNSWGKDVRYPFEIKYNVK